MKPTNSNVTDCKGHYQDFQVLKAHYSNKHNVAFEYPFKCEFCNISFILEEALLHHERTEHSSKISIELCVDCDIDFFSIATKLVHEDMYHRSVRLVMENSMGRAKTKFSPRYKMYQI